MSNHETQRKSKQKAQSIIEYCLLIATVIIAVMVMGPYVIKSWNAHVKTWEYSINDSLGEERAITTVLDCEECVRSSCLDSCAWIGYCWLCWCEVSCDCDVEPLGEAACAAALASYDDGSWSPPIYTSREDCLDVVCGGIPNCR